MDLLNGGTSFLQTFCVNSHKLKSQAWMSIIYLEVVANMATVQLSLTDITYCLILPAEIYTPQSVNFVICTPGSAF